MEESLIIEPHVDIPLRRVMTRLGYKNNAPAPAEKVMELIKDELRIARDLLDPKGMYRRCALVLEAPDRIQINKQFQCQSRKLYRFLKHSLHVHLIAVTIGGKLEQHATALQENGEISRAVIADAIGSETAEHAAALLHKHIRHMESMNGLATTGRYSPGYGDWDLDNQTAFHKLLKTERIGISLTDRNMMVPQKSVSAVVGSYRKDNTQ